MKKFLCILALLTYSGELQAQVGEKFKPSMETVQYSLPVLAVADSVFFADLDSLLSNTHYPEMHNSEYKYLKVSMEPDESGTKFFVELSKYPGRKGKQTIGCVNHNHRIFIVSGILPEGLLYKTAKKRNFMYKDYMQPSIYMLEDDLPTWIFNYKNGRLYSEYPKCR